VDDGGASFFKAQEPAQQLATRLAEEGAMIVRLLKQRACRVR
jgi:hypothetical protein